MGMLKPQQTPLQNDQAISKQAMAQTEPAQTPAAPPSDLSQEFEGFIAKAVTFVYDVKFEQLLDMFQQSGAEGFADAMATVINSAITHVKESSPIDHRMAAVIGMDLYLKLVGDIATGKLEGQAIVPNLTMQQVQDALPKTIRMYANINADITEEDMNVLLQEIQRQQGGNA